MPRNGPLRTIGNFDEMQGGSAATPSYERSVGSDNMATGQNPSAVSSGAGLLIVGARSGRRSVTITNVTGSQAVYIGGAGVTTGNGFFLAGTVGAAITLAFTGSLFATSPGATAQTLAFVETY
jgi:hypothetical protein